MVFEQYGITWDPREPPPSPIQRQHDLERQIAAIQHRRPRPLGHHIHDYRLPQLSRQGFQPVEARDALAEPAPEPINPRYQAGEYLRQPSNGGFLPPVSVTVKAQLIQDTTKVSITQLFVNESSSIIPKASYTFPLPQGCTVIGFVCRVGRDKILKGKVKPKEEARDTFDRAVELNETAGLVDQNTTEIFTTTLGNIPANTKLKVEISYLALLKYRFEGNIGLTTFTLPTCIAPRFGTPPQGLQQTWRTSTNLRELAVEVNILAPEVITSVTSTSHNITVEMGAGRRTHQSWQEFVESGHQQDPRLALVLLPETVTHLDKDFVLEIRTQPETGLEVPEACIETHPDLEGHKAIMLTIPPEFMLGQATADNTNEHGISEIIFVADLSGSMSDKIDALKSSITFFLKGIPTDRHFNIWCFGTDYRSLWPQSELFTDRTLQYALNYVSSTFKSDMGGTKLLPALETAVAARGLHRTTDIVVLTDGEVWDLDATLDFVAQTRKACEGRCRFFALGIGNSVSHSLVEGIAKQGGGYAEVIPLASNGGWESSVVAVLKATLTSHIGPISIEMGRQNMFENPREIIQAGTCGN